MQCPQCGEFFPATAKECKCGYKVEARPEPGPEPTGGERAFAWVFSLFYLSVMMVVIGIVVLVLMVYLFKADPKESGFAFLIPFAVWGMLPHATKAVAAALADTRGQSALARLGRILATIHG